MLGKITLAQAQQDISIKWLTIYNGVYGSVAPAATAPTPSPSPVPPLNTTTQNASVPVGATAKCKDGTYSSSKTRSGTCSHHGGACNGLTNKLSKNSNLHGALHRRRKARDRAIINAPKQGRSYGTYFFIDLIFLISPEHCSTKYPTISFVCRFSKSLRSGI